MYFCPFQFTKFNTTFHVILSLFVAFSRVFTDIFHSLTALRGSVADVKRY